MKVVLPRPDSPATLMGVSVLCSCLYSECQGDDTMMVKAAPRLATILWLFLLSVGLRMSMVRCMGVPLIGKLGK